MSNYSKTTDFAAKDSLPSGDSGKIIRGSEFETEFDNISTAIATKADAASPTFTGTVTIDGLTVNGNTTLGNAATDTVTVTADIASNLIPSADDTYDLGASGAEWNDLYVDGVAYIDTIAGFATTENITFGDNDKAIFGAGSDLEIYHDGTHSYIADVGSGVLFLRGESNIVLESNSGSNYFEGTSGGASRVYHAGNEKLATTSTGIDVTGTVTADGLTVSKASGDIATLEGTGTTTDVEANLVFNPVYDVNARIVSAREGAALTSRLSLETGTANDFSTTERLRISGNGNISFYEDTGTTPKFRWNASEERLGIGTSSPSNLLHLQSSLDTLLKIESTDTVVRLDLTDSGGTSLIQNTSGKLVLQADNANTAANSYLGFEVDGSEAMRIDSSGRVGIGTSSPQYPLHTYGAVGISDDNDSARYRFIVDDDGTNARFRIRREKANGAASSSNDLTIVGGNVGIGTISPSAKLHVQEDGTGLRLQGVSPDTNGTFLDFYNSSGSRRGLVGFTGAGTTMVVSNDESGPLAFQTGNTERARVDSSGRLLVGKSTYDANVTVGIEATADGYLNSVRDGSRAARFNRLTSDGEIIGFAKDGTTVGSIGVLTNRLYIGNGDTGLKFSGADDLISPIDASDGTGRDAAIDLGSSSTRFKDLYLSGGAYLGGTAAANKLDDYEEGTFTPVFADASSGGNTATGTFTGTYTKVGRLVTISLFAVNIDTTGMTSSNALIIRGLPFNTIGITNQAYHVGSCRLDSFTFTGNYVSPETTVANSDYLVLKESTSGAADQNLNVSSIASGSADLFLTLTYITA